MMEKFQLFDRALLLFNQNRPDQAENALRQLLAVEPDFGPAHSLLSLCIARDRDQLRAATEEAERGISCSPYDGYAHYVHATILDLRNRKDEAWSAMKRAIELEPEEAMYYGKIAELLAGMGKWKECLVEAEIGLQYDAEDESCRMIRSLALERLGRVEDSLEEAERAVQNDPDNSYAHSSLGWALIQNRQYKSSQLAFREALRLNPNNELARQGMIQALNSNNLLYRLVHRFISWMSRLESHIQWAVIIGLVVVMNVLSQIARQNPEFRPYITPLTMLYLGFVLLTWISNPLFNMLLRFHPFGQHLLTRREKWASNLIAGTLLTGLTLAVISYARFGVFPAAWTIALMAVFLVLPISVAFDTDEGWPLKVAIGVACGFTLLFLWIAYYHVFDLLIVIRVPGFLNRLITTYQLGILIYCFVGPKLEQIQVRN